MILLTYVYVTLDVFSRYSGDQLHFVILWKMFLIVCFF